MSFPLQQHKDPDSQKLISAKEKPQPFCFHSELSLPPDIKKHRTITARSVVPKKTTTVNYTRKNKLVKIKG
jgi:hypothetical protein